MRIRALFIESLSYQLDESSGRNYLQHGTERKNANQKLSFIVLIIPELDLIELVVKLQSLLLEMREMEKHTLKSVSFVVKQHSQFTHALLRNLHTVCVIFLQKLTGPDSGEIDGMYIALSTGLEPELIVLYRVLQAVRHAD